MIEMSVLVLPVLALSFFFLWIGAFVLRGPLRPGSHRHGALFTALMIGGIAACVHERPYAAGDGVPFLVVVLGASLLVSMYSLRLASLLASWVLANLWIIGAATRIERCMGGDSPTGPPPPPTEHFGTVVFILSAGSLVIHLLMRRRVRDELPRVRILDR